MKRIVLGAAVAAVAAPAFAADVVEPVYIEEPMLETTSPWSGHIEGYLGGITLGSDGDSESGWVYGGAGRVNYNFNRNWNIQGDLLVDAISADGSTLVSYGAATHVYWRDPSSFALGAFATIGGFGGDYSADDVYRWSIGPEGQVYFGNFTLYGQAYFGQFTDGSEAVDIWGVRGVARYFVTENLRLDGELGHHTLDLGPVDLDTFTAAAQVSYRFTGSPLTVFGRYQYENLSISASPIDLDIHKYVVGLRLTFGADTLLAEDRNGATMDTYRPNVPFLD